MTIYDVYSYLVCVHRRSPWLRLHRVLVNLPWGISMDYDSFISVSRQESSYHEIRLNDSLWFPTNLLPLQYQMQLLSGLRVRFFWKCMLWLWKQSWCCSAIDRNFAGKVRDSAVTNSSSNSSCGILKCLGRTIAIAE